jgi:hypothetical protein
MDEVDETNEITCAVCLTGTDSENTFTTVDDDVVCEDCMRMCEKCEDIHTINSDMNYVDNQEMWCMSCTEDYAYWCDSCEYYTTEGTVYIRDRQASWCTDCASDAHYCDDCDEYYGDGCNNCEQESKVIHDYSYRPDAIFHSTDKNERLFFGIEIEVEAGRKVQEASEYAYQLEEQELAYLKHDGSLNCGFEVVTHPMSHDFYKNEADDFFKVIEGLRSNYRVKSWDTSTCGLHIHISRSGFNGGPHMHRFLNLIYSNQSFYETLAGRSSDQWAKFTDILQEEYKRDAEGNRTFHTNERGYHEYDVITRRTFKHKLDNNRSSDRYSAVNTQNRETLEMRIFRGTVNGDTIKAHLDLAHASVEYTRTMSIKDIREGGALTSTQFIRYIAENAELYPNLFNRINKLIPVVATATI